MFTPTRLEISNITKANPAVVTTSTDHNLTTGQVVRVNVPRNYGMVELNHLALIITVLSATTFSLQATQVPPLVNVDSRQFTAFTIPSDPSFVAEIIPIGAGPTPKTSPNIYFIKNVCESKIDDATSNVEP